MNPLFEIGVVGAGTMGNGIAHVFALSEISKKVLLIDLNIDALNNARKNIEKNLYRQYSKNIISESQIKSTINKIEFSCEISTVANCDLVIEAVKEDENIKSILFKKLDSICLPETILASNTSSISITNLSKGLNHKNNVIGMHFMNPVPVMKLVEIIKGEYTANSIVERTLNYVSSINKISIECNDSPGFVSNRILMPMINEAAYTLMEGVASSDAIDQIMKLGMGHPMGPLKLADLIGVDVCVSIMKVLLNGFDNKKYTVCPLLEEMIKDNKLGVKTGQGFYKY